MTRTEIETACRLAADLIHGASISPRKGGLDRTSTLIVLPVPGLHVRVTVRGMNLGTHQTDNECVGTLELVMPAHHSVLTSCNLPSFAHGKTEAGATRIANCIRGLVLDAVGGAPRRHARMGTPVRHHKLDCWVPANERALAMEVAESRGMSVSELMRRGLALAIRETGGADRAALVTSCSERHARQALRLLAACNPDACADEVVRAAHVGGMDDVLRGLRKALDASDTNVLAAQLLGLEWLYGEPMPAQRAK